MNKRKRFIINGIIMSIVGIAIRTVGIVFGAYISGAVGAVGVGLNALVMSVFAFALTFATSGINLTVTRLVASHIGDGSEGEIGRTIRGAVIYAGAFSLAATMVLVGFSGFISVSVIGDPRATFPLQILSISLIPSAMLGVIEGYFVARGRIVRKALLTVLSQVFRIAVTVILLLGIPERGVEESVGALCIGYSLTELLSFVLGLILFLIDRIGCRRGARGADIRPVAKMALPLAVSSYIRSGLLALEHSIIPKRLEQRGESLSDALAGFGGMHGMALPLVTYPMTPLSSVAGLLLPEFAEAEASGDRSRLKRIAVEAVSSTLIYAALASAVLLVFSEELGYGIYNSYSAGYYISILAPVVPLMYIDHVVDSMLKGIGEQVYSMWVNIADSALSVALVWLLIPIFGIEGYAIVIILMEAFNFALSYKRLKRRIGIRLKLLPSVVAPIISAALAAIIAESLFVIGSSVLIWQIVLKIIFTVCLYIIILMPVRSAFLYAGNKLAEKKQKDISAD